jgi:hypothetical protein
MNSQILIHRQMSIMGSPLFAQQLTAKKLIGV